MEAELGGRGGEKPEVLDSTLLSQRNKCEWKLADKCGDKSADRGGHTFSGLVQLMMFVCQLLSHLSSCYSILNMVHNASFHIS